MLNKEIPFLRIVLPLCAGIISGLYFNPDTNCLAAIFICILAIFAFSVKFNNYRTNQLFGVAFTLTLFAIGLFLYLNQQNSFSELKSEETIFACTLSDYPEEKTNTMMLTVKLLAEVTNNLKKSVKGSMIIYCRKDSSLKAFLPGDLLVLKCRPLEIRNKGNPYEFNYKFHMENLNIRYYSFITINDIIQHRVPGYRKLPYKALILREKIIDIYKQRGITGDRLAIVAAITLGQKNMLDQEQKQNFMRAGVIHIMAVSGLHVGILSIFIFNLLFFLRHRFNNMRVIITILLLWIFAFITGLTPSVMRATLMFTFLQAGTLVKRKANGINSVLASAFVLIIINPSVIFEAGFILSFSAVIYIISFYNDFYRKLLFRNKLADKIWQAAVITVIAQAGTLPITIMLFNRFPTYFILTNILIIPFANLLIILGCLVPLMFPIQFLSGTTGYLLNYLAGFTEQLTKWFSALPLSNIENIGMTKAQSVLLEITIFLFLSYWLKKQRFSLIYPLSFLLLFVISGTVIDIKEKKSNKLIVYNTPGFQTIGIKDRKNSQHLL